MVSPVDMPHYLRRLLSFDRPPAVADAIGVSTADALSLLNPTPTTAQMFGEVRRCSLLAADAEVLHALERDNEIADRSVDRR